MKQHIFTLIIFLIITVNAYNQTVSKIYLIKHIDSVVLLTDKQQKYLLQQCDNIVDIYENKVYKCWSYDFRDSGKNDVRKVAISFNNCAEEFSYYYENNKVILVQQNTVANCKAKLKWRIYIHNDREIAHKGKLETIRRNEVEAGYYWLAEALTYAGHQPPDYGQSDVQLPPAKDPPPLKH